MDKAPIVLPKYATGAGHPRPVGVNFYQVYDHHPEYLLCTFDIDEKDYQPAQEVARLEAALTQVRTLGPERFPPVDWVAVMIVNRA